MRDAVTIALELGKIQGRIYDKTGLITRLTSQVSQLKNEEKKLLEEMEACQRGL